MKKLLKAGVASFVALTLVIGCTACASGEDSKSKEEKITVSSREDGSGTRGAFVELFGVEEKNDAGKKIDMTTIDAKITNSTSVMMTSIAGNKNAIGYISLGSLNDMVKALNIDGVQATAENIKNGSYKIARPFAMVTGEKVSDLAKDFMAYILSTEGQKIVADNKYISLDGVFAYIGNKPAGKLVIAGSSSVNPVMEKIKEAYLEINKKAEIEIQANDSTTGVNSVIDGVCDIGMVSRELKDSESAKGVKSTVLAMDGIAVVVNVNNQFSSLTKEQVKNIFTGAATQWNQMN